MGFLKNMKDAVGQAQEAAAGAAEWQQNGGGAPAGWTCPRDGQPQLAPDAGPRAEPDPVGRTPARRLIRGHVDTGENVAGNPVWIFDLEISPEGGAAYAVQHREIVSSMAMGSYGDGTSLACRIDRRLAEDRVRREAVHVAMGYWGRALTGLALMLGAVAATAFSIWKLSGIGIFVAGWAFLLGGWIFTTRGRLRGLKPGLPSHGWRPLSNPQIGRS